DVGGVIVAVARHANGDLRALEAVTMAMAEGLTAAVEPPKQILAILGAVVIAHVSGVAPRAAEPIIRTIESVAARYDIDPIPDLRQYLTGILTDPTDAFRMSPEAAQQAVDQALPRMST